MRVVKQAVRIALRRILKEKVREGREAQEALDSLPPA